MQMKMKIEMKKKMPFGSKQEKLAAQFASQKIPGHGQTNKRTFFNHLLSAAKF